MPLPAWPIGAVVSIDFPYSDLSATKPRPAIVMAQDSDEDWILCQVTTNPYGDRRAIRLDHADFASGGLSQVSFARPGKLFTAHYSLIQHQVGVLKQDVQTRIAKVASALLLTGK